MRIVVPFGFYGWGNIGDEATLQGFAQLLARTGVLARVSVGSRNPTHTARVEPAFRYFDASRPDPRRWIAKLRASAHAVVGGTPIMDVLGEWPLCDVVPLVRAVDRWNVPMAFIGVGIENLRLSESRRTFTREIVPRVRHWSVRSDRDRQRLTEYGTPPDIVTVAADMAWLMEPATSLFGQDRLRRWHLDLDRPLIGVNLVNEKLCFDQQPAMADALAKALDEFIHGMDAQVIFLSNEVRDDPTFDKAAAARVLGRMRRADRAMVAPSEYFSPVEMMSIISRCTLTISMRYHFCLFSALQGVPFVAIERSDKVSDLCRDMDWPASVVPPRFEAADIVDHGIRLRQHDFMVRSRLAESVARMRERALRNAASLNALTNGRPLSLRVAGTS